MLEVRISYRQDQKDQRTLCYVKDEDQLEALVSEMAYAYKNPMIDMFDETRTCWGITAKKEGEKEFFNIYIDGYQV